MRIRFTKMQGAGNDFVVLDETRGTLGLSAAQYRFLADRHFGVGADQILTVRPSPAEGIDFQYVIHNADGGEVEQCGNGARCFVVFVRERGLTSARTIARWYDAARSTLRRSASSGPRSRIAYSSAVLSPENEKSSPGTRATGNANASGSPSRASRSIAAPPG